MAPRGSNLHDVLGRIAQDHQVARLGPQDVLELLTSFSLCGATQGQGRFQLALYGRGAYKQHLAWSLQKLLIGHPMTLAVLDHLPLFEDRVRQAKREVDVGAINGNLPAGGRNGRFPTAFAEKASDRIQQLCLHFPRILVQSRWYMKSHVAPAVWPHLWSSPA